MRAQDLVLALEHRDVRAQSHYFRLRGHGPLWRSAHRTRRDARQRALQHPPAQFAEVGPADAELPAHLVNGLQSADRAQDPARPPLALPIARL